MASKFDKARERGIPISGSLTDYRTPCPECSPKRRKKTDPCLHVTITADAVRWFCFHCDFKGATSDDDFRADAVHAGGARAGRGASRPARTGNRQPRWY